MARTENCQRGEGKWPFEGKWKWDPTHIWGVWTDRRQFIRRIRKVGQARGEMTVELCGNQPLMLLVLQLEVLGMS